MPLIGVGVDKNANITLVGDSLIMDDFLSARSKNSVRKTVIPASAKNSNYNLGQRFSPNN